MIGGQQPRQRRLLVAVLAVALLLAAALTGLLRRAQGCACEQTYMYASYVEVPVLQERWAAHRYRLRLYREAGFAKQGLPPSGLPALLIPGNGGSYEQVRSLASESARLSARARQAGGDAAGGGGVTGTDWYSLDLNGELSAFDGHLLAEQTAFALDCLAQLAAAYGGSGGGVGRGGGAAPDLSRLPPNLRPPAMHGGAAAAGGVLLVGHSMGGVVARAAAAAAWDDPRLGPGSVALLLTLASPHRAAPLMLQPGLARFYDGVLARPLPEGLPAVSVHGGGADMQVSPYLTRLPQDRHQRRGGATLSGRSWRLWDGGAALAAAGGSSGWEAGEPPGSLSLSLSSEQIPGVWLAAGHTQIDWCNQLVGRLAAALVEVHAHQARRSPQTRRQLLDASGGGLLSPRSALDGTRGPPPAANATPPYAPPLLPQRLLGRARRADGRRLQAAPPPVASDVLSGGRRQGAHWGGARPGAELAGGGNTSRAAGAAAAASSPGPPRPPAPAAALLLRHYLAGQALQALGLWPGPAAHGAQQGPPAGAAPWEGPELLLPAAAPLDVQAAVRGGCPHPGGGPQWLVNEQGASSHVVPPGPRGFQASPEQQPRGRPGGPGAGGSVFFWSVPEAPPGSAGGDFVLLASGARPCSGFRVWLEQRPGPGAGGWADVTGQAAPLPVVQDELVERVRQFDRWLEVMQGRQYLAHASWVLALPHHTLLAARNASRVAVWLAPAASEPAGGAFPTVTSRDSANPPAARLTAQWLPAAPAPAAGSRGGGDGSSSGMGGRPSLSLGPSALVRPLALPPGGPMLVRLRLAWPWLLGGLSIRIRATGTAGGRPPGPAGGADGRASATAVGAAAPPASCWHPVVLYQDRWAGVERSVLINTTASSGAGGGAAVAAARRLRRAVQTWLRAGVKASSQAGTTASAGSSAPLWDAAAVPGVHLLLDPGCGWAVGLGVDAADAAAQLLLAHASAAAGMAVALLLLVLSHQMSALAHIIAVARHGPPAPTGEGARARPAGGGGRGDAAAEAALLEGPGAAGDLRALSAAALARLRRRLDATLGGAPPPPHKYYACGGTTAAAAAGAGAGPSAAAGDERGGLSGVGVSVLESLVAVTSDARVVLLAGAMAASAAALGSTWPAAAGGGGGAGSSAAAAEVARRLLRGALGTAGLGQRGDVPGVLGACFLLGVALLFLLADVALTTAVKWVLDWSLALQPAAAAWSWGAGGDEPAADGGASACCCALCGAAGILCCSGVGGGSLRGPARCDAVPDGITGGEAGGAAAAAAVQLLIPEAAGAAAGSRRVRAAGSAPCWWSKRQFQVQVAVLLLLAAANIALGLAGGVLLLFVTWHLPSGSAAAAAKVAELLLGSRAASRAASRLASRTASRTASPQPAAAKSLSVSGAPAAPAGSAAAAGHAPPLQRLPSVAEGGGAAAASGGPEGGVPAAPVRSGAGLPLDGSESDDEGGSHVAAQRAVLHPAQQQQQQQHQHQQQPSADGTPLSPGQQHPEAWAMHHPQAPPPMQRAANDQRIALEPVPTRHDAAAARAVALHQLTCHMCHAWTLLYGCCCLMLAPSLVAWLRLPLGHQHPSHPADVLLVSPVLLHCAAIASGAVDALVGQGAPAAGAGSAAAAAAAAGGAPVDLHKLVVRAAAGYMLAAALQGQAVAWLGVVSLVSCLMLGGRAVANAWRRLHAAVCARLPPDAKLAKQKGT